MRDIFEDIFAQQPPDPVEAARRSLRPQLRRRFYQQVQVLEQDGAFGIALDGRPVMTPARRKLAAPSAALTAVLAAEWEAQREAIDPANMPLTRLANTIIDGVADARAAVAADVGNYLASDLVCYRATSPEGLVQRQRNAWDPVIAWARDELGASFALGGDMVFVTQPDAALAAARAAIPSQDIWRLGALHTITTLTGSALIALGVLRGRFSADEAWAAAHVDEDWNMEFWGRDSLAMERRAYRLAEMQAACRVLREI